MPNSKSQNRRGRLTKKSLSFHGGSPASVAAEERELRRPRTVPDLLSFRGAPISAPEMEEARIRRPVLTKLLLNVTVMGSLGAVQVVASPESTVGDLIAAAIRQYAKEGRRPILPASDTASFGLHYSQFSLESLDREEKLMELGSRNFFLCPKASVETTPSTCSKEAEKGGKVGFQWMKFMEFLL